MKNKPLWIKWIFCLIPLLLAALMYFILPYFPKFTEYVYTRGIFRLTFAFQWLVSFIPFSITEILVLSLVPIIVGLMITFIIKFCRSKNKKSTAEKGIRFVALCLSLFLFIFMVTDGANFSRLPLYENMKLESREYTAEDLYQVTSTLAKNASAARENLKEDKNGVAKPNLNLNEMLRLADDSYKNIKKEYPFLTTGTRKVKSVMLSHKWSYTGTTGVYCPWTVETNVNTDVLPFSIPSTAAHEIAHTMGFAKENECNFLAWLASDTSGMPDFVYSGNLSAFIHCSNALYKADKNLWRKAVSNCSEGMIRDLNAKNEYWDKFRGEVMENSQNVNDTFIKVNGVESGILSYDEMVELMLRYFDTKDLI